MTLQAVPQKVSFTLDNERRCRALGHSFQRDFRHATGQFELQTSDECYRCGIPKASLVSDD